MMDTCFENAARRKKGLSEGLKLLQIFTDAY